MGNSIEWQPPMVIHTIGLSNQTLMSGVVPMLTPATYRPELATEELERAQANAYDVERARQVKEMKRQFRLELGGDF